MMERRQTVDNRGDKLLMIFTEPEAQDFWLTPGDECEIRALITDPKVNFEIAFHEEGISAYPPHKMGYITVWCGNEELHCGHQRPAGWGEGRRPLADALPPDH